jgi:uncharacterized membrane protein YjjB (DUF3815 family)
MDLTVILMFIQYACFAAFPAVGFAMVFNVPPKALKYCALGGAVGHSMRTLFLHYGASLVFASFCASLAVGFLSVYWGKRMLAHPKVFSAASIISLMPGVYAFKAVLGIVKINDIGYDEMVWEGLVNHSITAFFVLMALVMGLVLPGLLFYRTKSVV